MITKNKQKGFALVLALVLLLAMSLMGGALIVIASSDHQGNNSSDEYQQTFYVAETALLQAQKSLIDKILGPIDNSGQRSSNRSIPRNTLSIDPTPVHVTALLKVFPIKIVMKRVIIKIAIPKPTLFIKSDSI